LRDRASRAISRLVGAVALAAVAGAAVAKTAELPVQAGANDVAAEAGARDCGDAEEWSPRRIELMARRDASLGAAELVAIGGRPDTP